VYKRRGALRFDLQQQRYSFDKHESLAIVVGELTIKEILAARPYMKGRLLDVGCGKRPYALIYDSLVEQSVGTEVAFSPHGTLAADVINYAENLPFSDQSFDTILCTEVLEHTRRPQQVLQEFARVLKPGGYLLLTVPFMYPVHEAPHDYWRFTNYGLQAICETAGLTPLYVHQKGGVGATLISLWVNVTVRGINLLSKMLHCSTPLRENSAIRWALSAPQLVYLWLSQRLNVPAVSGKLDSWMTSGYVVLAQRPVEVDRD
jgi:SAM-dependent methyltransferase